jgi:NADPH-dependent 2,4-dienoyl-CoA reductase/sulfur reductase-like enzyme
LEGEAVKHYHYLIVGGGMAAAAAVQGIREVDKACSIGIIAAEPHPPYDRPPLSKGLWTGNQGTATVTRKLPDQVELQQGRSAQTLDLASQQVTDDQGQAYSYEKLLLATGSTPRRLPFGGDNIIYFRTLDDYQRLRALADKHDQFAVVGGSFIGSEIAAALAMQGKQVTMIFPGPGICHNIFPADVANFLNGYYQEKGVTILAGDTIAGVEGVAEQLTLVAESGRRVEVNGIIAGIGVEPNLRLAVAAGLNINRGVLVNPSLQTSHANIYAAGDIAEFHDGTLGMHRRVEHEDNANSMGKAAGRAMAGATVHYDYSPMFYSDLFDLGYEAVGELDARLETIADWREPYGTGVIYYLRDGRVRGVLLWNVWGKADAARELIAAGQPLSAEKLIGRIR